MAELKFKRYEGYVGGSGTKFITENYKICPLCHTHEPNWSCASQMNGVGSAQVFSKSFGFIKCEKCNAIYKHKLIDLVKFTDQKALRGPFGQIVDCGSMDVNDTEFEIYEVGNTPGAHLYAGYRFLLRHMNADILRVKEGHVPNPSNQEAHAEPNSSSMYTYIKDSINEETISDLSKRKEMIEQGICPKCNGHIEQNYFVCPTCGEKLREANLRKVCTVCGSTLNENGLCPKCSYNYQQPQPNGYYQGPQPNGYYQGPQPNGYYQGPQPNGYYQQPQYNGNQQPQSNESYSSGVNKFSLLSFIFSNVALLLLMMINGVTDEVETILLFIISLGLIIVAFVFQFIARSKPCATIWKVFSWISFGICVFVLSITLIIFMGIMAFGF